MPVSAPVGARRGPRHPRRDPHGALRSLAGAPNVFAIESAIDELAAAIASDPLELPFGAAIANAVARATGARVRTNPIGLPRD